MSITELQRIFIPLMYENTKLMFSLKGHLVEFIILQRPIRRIMPL